MNRDFETLCSEFPQHDVDDFRTLFGQVNYQLNRASDLLRAEAPHLIHLHEMYPSENQAILRDVYRSAFLRDPPSALEVAAHHFLPTGN